MDETGFSRIVDSIYAAAASHERWPDALGLLGEAFGCCAVSLIDRDLTTMTGRTACWGVDENSQREFFEVWGWRNPLVQRTRAWRQGQIETDIDILPKRELMGSDYYNGFMRPRDMHAILRLTLNAGTGPGEGYNQALSLVRSSARGDYDWRDVDISRRFMPHLERASAIARHLEKSRVLVDGLTEMLDCNPASLILLDCTGRIVLANRAARAMAEDRDAFVLRRGRIEAFNRRDDAALQALIARATGEDPGVDAVRGGAVSLSRRSERAPYNAVVAPLESGRSLGAPGPAAFVLITDPDASPALSEAILAQLFGLTPAEVRVAKRLMIGEAPEEVAEALNIRISTARWHLGALYRKTGTSRQAELVRLLLSLPMLRPQ